MTVKIQSCFHMPSFVIPSSQSLKDTKIPFAVKNEAHTISSTLEGEISVNVPKLHEVPNLTVQTSVVSAFDQVSMATMAEAQAKDSVLGLVIQYVHKGKTKGLCYFKN